MGPGSELLRLVTANFIQVLAMALGSELKAGTGPTQTIYGIDHPAAAEGFQTDQWQLCECLIHVSPNVILRLKKRL